MIENLNDLLYIIVLFRTFFFNMSPPPPNTADLRTDGKRLYRKSAVWGRGPRGGGGGGGGAAEKM